MPPVRTKGIIPNNSKCWNCGEPIVDADPDAVIWSGIYTTDPVFCDHECLDAFDSLVEE